MKTYITLFLSLAMFPAFAQATGDFIKQSHIFENDTLPYQILYPADYDPSKKIPLILFLHGAGERGRDNEKQMIHGSRLFLDPVNQKNFPAIVVFPQCPEGGYWSSVDVDRSSFPLKLEFDYNKKPTPSLSSVENLLQEVIKNHNVDARRIYVMGLSMGGMGTFEIVHRNPKLFAAAVAICGGGDTKLYSTKTRQVDFWIFHGAKDNVVDVSLSREMVKRLKSLGANVKYTEYPEANHNSWDSAFAEPGLFPWLFSSKR